MSGKYLTLAMHRSPSGPKAQMSVQLHIVVVVLCVQPLRCKAAPNVAQVEEVYITPTLWCVVISNVGLGLL